ncbi:MAG: beta-glucosidase [Phototrophicales bacterium]|jgi:beta-glucosidase|nr:MAG: beta-glucosidase [Phototrophicales bacterium]
MTFPTGFIWGAAAASYQIEGAAFEDGKGLSVWDVFSHTPNKIWGDETGDIACDHYHRVPQDIALMKQIGLQAYRLSVSWARVLPDGIGKTNPTGLDFYNRLIDTLLEANITPHITLFHWDFPYALYTKGGWLNRDSADWFAEYTTLMVKTLGDRVKDWITLNEPPAFALGGHEQGRLAPGDRLGDSGMMRVIHHILLAHGYSVQAIRAHSPQPTSVSLAMNIYPVVPTDTSPATIQTAHDLFWSIDYDQKRNAGLWLDPMLIGTYPDAVVQKWGDFIPMQNGDMAKICQPLDYLGLNIYFGEYADAHGRKPAQQGHPYTMMDWLMLPESMYWGSKYMYERYRLPIVITENGLASMDWVAVDGGVHDANRIDYMTRYLREFKRAGADNIPINGYFYWSIMDNYEWAHGYRKRFGLIYVDYDTQIRTLKDSAYWYKDVIATNGAILDDK